MQKKQFSPDLIQSVLPAHHDSDLALHDHIRMFRSGISPARDASPANEPGLHPDVHKWRAAQAFMRMTCPVDGTPHLHVHT